MIAMMSPQGYCDSHRRVGAISPPDIDHEYDDIGVAAGDVRLSDPVTNTARDACVVRRYISGVSVVAR
jgi:hypothetical protein